MQVDLLSGARWELRVAQWCLQQEDDEALQTAVYHISHGVEKILKACLKELGVGCAGINRLENLLIMLPAGQILIRPERLLWIKEQASTLHKWRTEGQCVGCYSASRWDVLQLWDDVTNLYSEVANVIGSLNGVTG